MYGFYAELPINLGVTDRFPATFSFTHRLDDHVLSLADDNDDEVQPANKWFAKKRTNTSVPILVTDKAFIFLVYSFLIRLFRSNLIRDQVTLWLRIVCVTCFTYSVCVYKIIKKNKSYLFSEPILISLVFPHMVTETYHCKDLQSVFFFFV